MTESHGTALRRTTGVLFLVGAVAFATAASILSATFDWPDILREPGSGGRSPSASSFGVGYCLAG
jgi:hypothetical protein